MTPEQFQTQIGRLIATFGKNAYPDERVKLIHGEFSNVSEFKFRTMVDYFVGEYRTPPLLQDFRTMQTKFREREYEQDKEQLRQDSSDFWSCKYTPDDKKWIVQTIKKRIMGEVSDSDYAEFLQVLRLAEKNAKQDALQPPKFRQD